MKAWQPPYRFNERVTQLYTREDRRGILLRTPAWAPTKAKRAKKARPPRRKRERKTT